METDRTIGAEINAIAYEKCIPLNVTFEITLRCNIKCAHCYNFDRDEPFPRELIGQSLTSPEIIRIIDEVRDEGCLYMGFTGGEALLHPQLMDFIRHAKKRRMVVTLKSNGTLYTPELARSLVDAGVSFTDISVHGATAKTHDTFTGIPGSFEKTLLGIEAAVGSGMIVRLSFSLTRHTAPEIVAMRAMADRFGVKYTIDPHITGRYDGKLDTLDMKVDRQTLEALYEGPLSDLALGRPNFHPRRSVQCSCARGVCGITATGIVYPCIGAPVPSGNLREQSFKEVWWNSPEFKRIRGLSIDDFSACQPCPDRPFCHRSSGVVYSNTQNYTGPEAWTCMEASVLHGIYDKRKGTGALIASDSGALQRHSITPE